jgi:anti-sigma-K factor RskA
MTIELHTLSGAFALDAVSHEEAAAFRNHLEECAACSQEVRELQAAAARMGEVETLLPPAALKARVLAAAERTTQKPPRVPFGHTDDRRPRRWAPRLAAAAAAAVIAIAGGVGLSQLGDDDAAPPLAAPVVRVFGADDARTAEVTTSHGPVRVATSAERGEMAVDTSDLQTLDSGHVYQLWSIVDGTPVSVGVLADPGRGAAMALPGEGTEVAITVEPAGGSEQPTTEPIAEVDPAAV